MPTAAMSEEASGTHIVQGSNHTEGSPMDQKLRPTKACWDNHKAVLQDEGLIRRSGACMLAFWTLKQKRISIMIHECDENPYMIMFAR